MKKQLYILFCLGILLLSSACSNRFPTKKIQDIEARNTDIPQNWTVDSEDNDYFLPDSIFRDDASQWRDTLFVGRDTLIWTESPLLALLGWETMFPFSVSAGPGGTGFAKWCNRAFIATWRIKGNNLYLERIHPRHPIIRTEPQIRAELEKEGWIYPSLLKRILPPEDSLKARVEKITGRKFKNGRLQAGWVTGTRIAAGNYIPHKTGLFNELLFKDEYRYQIVNGKITGCTIYSMPKGIYDDYRKLSEYLSRVVFKDALPIFPDSLLPAIGTPFCIRPGIKTTDSGTIQNIIYRDQYNQNAKITGLMNLFLKDRIKKALLELPHNSFSHYLEFRLTKKQESTYILPLLVDIKKRKIIPLKKPEFLHKHEYEDFWEWEL